jgi:hypothetical protein
MLISYWQFPIFGLPPLVVFVMLSPLKNEITQIANECVMQLYLSRIEPAK